MKLERLAQALAPSGVLGDLSPEIRDLAYDARAVVPGALFFCYPGTRADGHAFAEEAVARGAAALVVERPLDLSVAQLVVGDARAAMAPAADEFFGRPTAELRVAGVTGTNGKTTTAYLLYSILAAAGLRPGLLTTVEEKIGSERRPAVRTTPEAIDLQRAFRAMLDAGSRTCALEATSHGSALKRLDRVRFAALAFTNLTQDHLDFHGTMERYYEAKRRLFFLDGGFPAAVNVDDPWGRRLAEDLRGRGREELLTFGFAEDADLRPDELELTPSGARFCAGGIELESRLRGRFNVENVLAAVALARLVDIGDEAVVAGVAALPGVPGRFQPVDEGQAFALVIDYAHTPDSLERALGAARELASGRVICVFGCGGERDREKRPLMGRVASELADAVILTSDNPRGEDPAEIVAEIAAGAGEDLDVQLDRRAAIARAVELAEPGDVVVVAGKGHEQGQEVAGRVLPFDDREVAREALRRLGAKT
jgi:UDP-N-acetylmuramoyl-L-alanyl-D-glutamate--2,6-diaminopimelate ligase